MNSTQVKYLEYLDRRRPFAEKHRHESPAFGFETFKKMFDDYHEGSDSSIRRSIEVLLFADKEDGLLRIQ